MTTAEPAATGEPLDLPLSGVRVLDLTTGPLAAIGRHLAEWGADVLRVELPGGGADRRTGRRVAGVSLGFAAANLGKRAVTLDLARPADRTRFTALLAGADILLENTPPTAPEAAALDVEGIRREHPSLVILSATPFGRTGPHAGWQATSPVFHALSGELSRSGIPGREPLLPPGDLPYDCAAAQAVFVVLLAYLERLRTGLGDHLDFAVLDGAVAALDPGYGIAGSATAGVPASRLPRGRPEARHQYPIIPCADGFVRLCILAPRQWRAMFAWMGSPAEFADPSYDKLTTRFASTTLLPAIARFFADRTRAELEQAGQSHGVPTAAVLDLDEALESEQIRARGAFTPVELAPGTAAPFPNGVLELDGHRAGIRGPAPTLPPHSAAPPSWAARPAPSPRDSSAGQDSSADQDSSAEPNGPDATDGRPLAGLRVLDLGVIVVGAEQGRLLADQGADVIKVENDAFPDGSRQARDGSAITVTFAAGHRNKRSLGLDLRSPRGRDLFLRLIADTDVVLTNYRPGTLESLGLGYDVLKKANPAVIVVDSSAFGTTGPWNRRLGYGPLVRACAGLTAQWRYPGEADGFSDALTVYPDHVAARIGIAGVLALLIRRRRTGIGGTVSVSQAEVMLGHAAAAVADKALVRTGAEVEGPTGPDAPWGVFPTAGDDDWCVVTVRGDDDWQALCRVLDRDDLATEPALTSADGRATARDRIDATLVDWLARHDAVEAMNLLQAAGIPAGAMLRVSELPSFPYYAERRLFRLSGHPHIRQTFYLENAPVRSGRLPDPPDNPAPLLGEHTEQILRETLGLTEAETAALMSDNGRTAGATR
ncbi:CaiB/BaiF CoA-transferase family protein [Frankia sp. QA3]|uniref:CaiB/BaiF CoA transferase family protein n=1 Tax=Frankia sp. QA3 TaxID=710111 RepID=UPI000269BFAD|nr:CoA transferase [Frankia sp. QA3]EIV91534.1 putative acyl-CoA transferase/carnitine dehydratase [Frankia sp. QA3]